MRKKIKTAVLAFCIACLSIPIDASAGCDDCQDFGKDKGCISAQFDLENGSLSGTITIGSRVKCVAGNSTCKRTACS